MEGEAVPQESQTIANRRAERLAEKVKNYKESLFAPKAWWSNTLFESLAILIAVSLNIYSVLPFLSSEAPPTSFSGPVIPLLAKILEFFGLSLSGGIQIVYVLLFLLFPVSFYVFIRKVTGRKIIALLATLFVSLPIAPFAKTRILDTFVLSDGHHISSLAFVPIALYGLLLFVRYGGAKNLVIASVGAFFVALISPFGFLTYAIFAGVTTFSEILLGAGRQKVVRLLVVFIFTYGLSSFWYNPGFSFWMITGPMGEEVRKTVGRLIPISFFALPPLATLGYLLFDRKPNLTPVFLAIFYLAIFAIIVWARGGLFPSLPNRYLPEFGIALSFVLALAVVRASSLLFRIDPYAPTVATLAASLVLIFIILAGKNLEFGDSSNVLGLWTEVQRGELWVAKDKFRGGHSIFGYLVTLATISSLIYLTLKVDKNENRNSG